MTDPGEIEGTPEHATDRGTTENPDFSMSSKPSLGNADVVRGLVSEFAAQIVAARKAYHQDKLTGDQAQGRVHELAKEYGAIVMGRGDQYKALPWNDPQRLGRRIKLVVRKVDGVTDPGEMLFMTVGSSLMALAAAHEDKRVTDDDAKHHAQTMLEDTANLILGLR